MLSIRPTTFEEFQRDATRGNVVAVTRSILADLQTPLGAFMRIAGDASHAFLLESIEGGERVARYSCLGANPVMVARSRGTETIVQRDGQREVVTRNGIEFLREYFSDKKLVQRPNIAPLSGGAVGYLGYDAARWFEPVLDVDGTDAGDTDGAVLMFFRNIVAFDRVRLQMEITSIVFTDEAVGDRARLRELYDAAVVETEKIEKKLYEEMTLASDARPRSGDTTVHFQSNWPRKDFEAAVDSVKEHIAAGDCYQVVIAQQFTKPTPGE